MLPLNSSLVDTTPPVVVQNGSTTATQAAKDHALHRVARWNADVLRRIIPHAQDDQLMAAVSKLGSLHDSLKSWNYSSEVAMSAVKLMQRRGTEDVPPLAQFGLIFAALAHPAMSVEASWALLQEHGLVKDVCINAQEQDALRACLLKVTTAIGSDDTTPLPEADVVSNLAQSAVVLTVAQMESLTVSKSKDAAPSSGGDGNSSSKDPIEQEIKADILVPKDNNKTPEEQEIYRLALWNVDLLHRVDDRASCQDLLNIVSQIGSTHQAAKTIPSMASLEWSCASQVAVAAFKLIQRFQTGPHAMSSIQKFGLVFAALAYPTVSADDAWALLTESGLSYVLCANPQDVQDLQACIVSATQAMGIETLCEEGVGIVATLAQAAVAWYTTQHWYTYIKWTERKFVDSVTSKKDNATSSQAETDAKSEEHAGAWFEAELKWLNDTVIPTLNRLDEQVMLTQVHANREAWERDGLTKVRAWSLKYQAAAKADQNNSNAKAA